MRRRITSVLLCLWASTAFAHGRPPSVQQLHFDPANPDRIIGEATWGMVFSDDGGETWSWICAAAYGVDARMEDPNVAFGPDGEILVGTFNGVFSSDDGCDWEDQPAFRDSWVVAIATAGERAFAVETRVFEGDRLWRYDDVWTPLGDPLEELVIETMQVAPSDADVLYLGGLRPRTAEQDRGAFVVRSFDGGETLERFEIPVRNEEFSAHVLGVDPIDPERVWAVVVTFDGEMADERLLLSTNGGRDWTTRHTLPQVGGFAFAPSGRLWVGSKLGGLWASDDGGRGWTKVDDVAVRCLAQRGDELWVCADQSMDGFAMAIIRESSAAEPDLEPILDLRELTEIRSCERCTDVGIICPAWLPDVAFDLGLDYAAVGIDPPMLNPDGGVGLPREVAVPEECGGPPIEKPGDCGCSAPGSSSSSGSAWLALAVLVYWRRRIRAKPSRASMPSPPEVPAA